MLSILIGLLPTLIGFLASFLPSLLSYLERKQQNEHEIALTNLRIQAAKQGITHAALLEAIKASNDEAKYIYQHDSLISNNGFINALRATVRPFITYAFFIFFIGIKATAITIMFVEGVSPMDALSIVWDDHTNAIFGSIIGFWFGTRGMLYAKSEMLVRKKD